jgi:hypothetical protein|tara:strand:+ start:63 stop:245 length:183 start_codon:yes stop_codon:yes gene_type:complete
MDIDTDSEPPKPIEQIAQMVKTISSDLSDIKIDLLFIKAKIKERQDNEAKVEIQKSWWLF